MEETSSNLKIAWRDFHGPNLGYVMDLYEQYLEDPNSVDEELRNMFDAWGLLRL